MSMTGSPRRLSEPIDARDSVVIRCCISFLTASLTSTSEPDEGNLVHLAHLDAGDTNHGAGLQPLDVGEVSLQVVPAARRILPGRRRQR